MTFLSPAGFENITFNNKLKSANPKVPFADPPYALREEGTQTQYSVYFKTNQITSRSDADQNTEFINRAANKFMMHYFPEYYPFMVERSLVTDDEWAEVDSYEQDYIDLHSDMVNSITVKSFTSKPNPTKNKVVYTTELDLYGIRDSKDDKYDNDGKPLLPDPAIFLSVLNRELSRGPTSDTVSIKFQNIPSEIEQISQTMTGFGSLMNQLQQQQGGAGLNSLQVGVNRIIKKITDTVHDSIDYRAERQSLYDTDYVIVSFDENTEIVGISYFIVAVTAGEKEQSTVGYITNIKYNPLFNDDVPLSLLKNYEFILQQALQDPTGAGGTGDTEVLDFFERLGIPGDSSGWGQPLPWGQEPVEVNDYENLEKLLKEANDENPKDPEKIIKLEALISDPIFQAKMKQAQKARVVNTTVQVLDVIDDIASMDVFNFMNATTEGRKANQILHSFGITDLVTEAIKCLTFGLGSSVSTVTQAVRDSIVDSTVSLNGTPTLPSMQPSITRPDFADFKPEIYFSITGNPPLSKRIQEMLLSAITQAGFEIIKGLAELFKFNCADILNGNQGEIDCGDELRQRNNRAAVDIPDLEGIISDVAGSKGLTVEEAYQYLSDVSQVLNPIEVCQLFNSPSQISNDTMTNILDYNSEYSLVAVQLNLNTATKIVSFFRSMSANIDTISFCNEIIEETVVAAIEECRICPPEDFASPQIQLLADIAENGFQPTVSKPEFLCPESENYLSNPVSERIIPQLFDGVMSNVQIYMAGSLESARTALLEPVVSTEIDPTLAGAFGDCNVELPEGQDAAAKSTAALSMLMDVFDVISDVFGTLGDVTDNPACSDIKDEKFQDIVDNLEVVSNAIVAALNTMPGVIDDVQSKLQQAQDNVNAGNNPHTKYEFPQKYKTQFQDAIQLPLISLSPGPKYTSISPEDSGIFNTGVEFNLEGARYVRSQLNFSFGGNNGASIVYDDFSNFKGVTVQYQIPLAGVDNTTTADLSSPYTNFVSAASWQTMELNPYVARFVEPLLLQFKQDDPASTDLELTHQIVGRDHPWSYGRLVQRMFEYFLDNGAFNTQTINNLQLFKNNQNCTPANVGDLFDADGIIDQMRREFAAAACYDSGSNQDKVRATLYYGLINMLIQACIDEVIVSNIVIFTALNMEDILSDKYSFKEMIISRVISAVERTITDGNPIVEREIFNYFSRLVGRPSTEAAGGVTHSYAPQTVVPGFESPGFPGNNSALIRFLVEERFGYTWQDGDETRTTIQAISNIIDPGSTKKLFEDFFLEDVVGIETPRTIEERNRIWGARAPKFQDLTETKRRDLFFLAPESGPDSGAIMLKYMFNSGQSSAPTVYEIFRLAKPSPNMSYGQIADFIKQSSEYKAFFHQAFNKDSILMIPVLYNIYLVDDQFGDVTAAFNSTKRSIIEMFEFTDGSTRPPTLVPRDNSYVDGLAKSGGPDIDSMMRDIFLKFLREFPLIVLKGLVELIDPHVALSKFIKDITGMALNEIIKAVQVGIDNADTPGMGPLKEDGITAEDIFSVIFCLYNISQQVPSEGFLADLPGQDNMLLGPRLSVEGIDLTGTIAGMLMIPPSPLGVIYLLIELLKIKIDDDISEGDDAVDSASEQEDVECPEGTEPL